MIISASRRTDIPGFFSEWFMRRLGEGYLYVRNPVNQHQVSEVTLSPDVVDCVVFWTKNPIPMLPCLDGLGDYPYYFQVTLTGYGRDIESGLPDKKKELIPALQELSRRIGKERVIWRYDPILFNEKYTPSYHLRAFSQIAQALCGCTEKCVISFVDIYRKKRRSMEALHLQEKPDEWLQEFAGRLHDIAARYGIRMASCAEKMDLSGVGIEHNSCIDKQLIEKITGCRLNVKKDPSQRPECGCVSSIDIGAYNTCLNGCRYCYASLSQDIARRNLVNYDPASPILCGVIRPEDKITKRAVRSLKR